MDKSIQVKISSDDNHTLSLQDILRSEAQDEKIRKANPGEISSKLFLYRQVEGPDDLVRLGIVVREAEHKENDYQADVELPREDSLTNICEACDLSLPSNCSQPNTTSKRGLPQVTLVRESSLSLVEIPTFISSSVTLGSISSKVSETFPLYDPRKVLEEKLAEIRANRSDPKLGKRSQWTVMCVALGFFGSCLILVGGMLSFTSDYQDRAIARMINMSLNQEAVETF
jgi:hypothetical protein